MFRGINTMDFEENREMSEFARISNLMGVQTEDLVLPTFHIIRKCRQIFPQEYAELDRKIIDYWKYERMSRDEIDRRIEISKRMARLIQEVYPSAELILMGSSASQCGSLTSDLDLCLAISHEKFGYESSRRRRVDILTNVAVVFQRAESVEDWIKDISIIHATVPILKCRVTDVLGDIYVDINCNNLAGVYNSYLLHHYARIDSRFPALCMTIKRWAEAANINMPMNGSLNSYTIKLMIVHFLQCAIWPPILPNLRKLCPTRFDGVKYCAALSEMRLFDTLPEIPSECKLNKRTPSELLMAFFDYYARFDYNDREISISHALVAKRPSFRNSLGRDAKIVIHGPFDSVNTARTVKSEESLEFIKEAFKRAAHIYLGPVPKAPIFDEIDKLKGKMNWHRLIAPLSIAGIALGYTGNQRRSQCAEHNQLIKKRVKATRVIQRFLVRTGAPGLSIGVSMNGDRVWSAGFGLADVEQMVPCTADTVMRIASISKSITATIAARLVQNGKLNLDTNVQEYLPDYPKKEFDGKPVDITIRQLLCHTSGIRHYKEALISAMNWAFFLQEYLPDYPKKEFDGKPVDITIRQLLCHTSGIRHYKEVIILMSLSPLFTEKILLTSKYLFI
uniref:PAP-associated domain-containing protein n=1 Tax=Ascaris lumbricoides TaxID=6252 RepID=A0A9J2PQ11_ASCLU